MNELIVLKQTAIIEEGLRSKKSEIEAKVAFAKNIVCTEESVKQVKDIRAFLNKEFAELETQRKELKAQVLAPYEAFELVYKECASDIYKSADKDLKTKIDEIEDGIKAEKTEKVVEYFNEYQQSKNVEFITYDRANINVTLSTSLKSLKDQAKAFIDKVSDDLALIDTQENKAEILVEYKQHLNVSRAITTVTERYKAIETEKARMVQDAEAKATREEVVQRIEKVVELSAPVVEAPVVEAKKYKVTFTVTGTMEELKQVKAFLENGGYGYDAK